MRPLSTKTSILPKISRRPPIPPGISTLNPGDGTASAEDITLDTACVEEMQIDSQYQKLAYVLKVSQGPSVKDFIDIIRSNKWTYRLKLTGNEYVDDVSTFTFEFQLRKSPCEERKLASAADGETNDNGIWLELIDESGMFINHDNKFTINREDIWSDFKEFASADQDLATHLQRINSFNELQQELDTLIVNIQPADAEAADAEAVVVPVKKDLSKVQLIIALLGALEAAYIKRQAVANENDIQIMVSCGISLVSSIYVLYKKSNELEAGADILITNLINGSENLKVLVGTNICNILNAIKASCDYNGSRTIENAKKLTSSLVVLTHRIMENNRDSAVGTGAAMVRTATVSSNILSCIVWELIHLPFKMYNHPKKTGAVTVIGLLFVAQMYRHEIVQSVENAATRHLWYRLTGWLSGVAQSRFTQWLRGESGFNDQPMCATSDDMKVMQDQLRQMTEQLAQQNAQQNAQSITGQCFNDGTPTMQMITGFTNNVFQAAGATGGQVVAGLLTAVARNPFQRIAGSGGGGKRKRTKKRKRRRRGGSKKTKRRGKKSKKGGKRRRGGSKKRNRRSQRKTKK